MHHDQLQSPNNPNLHFSRIPQIALRILQLPENLITPLRAPSPINLLHHTLLNTALQDTLRVAKNRVLLQERGLLVVVVVVVEGGAVMQVQGGSELRARLREFGAEVVEVVVVEFGGGG
jgi:hypothetical protein